MSSMTVKEAAVALGVKPVTVRAYIARRQLAATKVGNANLVESADVAGLVRAPRGRPRKPGTRYPCGKLRRHGS